MQADMSVNSSSSNVSNLHHPLYYKCSNNRVSNLIFTAFGSANFLLLLPLSIRILYLGLQRWRRQRSVSAAMTTSHSDLFTYHMVAMELIAFLGYGIYCCGMYIDLQEMMRVGYYIFYILLPAQISLQCLTCIERYLAVVHPVIYMGLKRAGGVRLRNISIGSVWLQCFGCVGLAVLYSPDFPNIPFFCLFAAFLSIISFCSLSVLRTLHRPGPGAVGGNREGVDQSKQRAFHTMMAINGAVLLMFAALLVCTLVDASPFVRERDGCVVLMSGLFFCLPSSLVLPLLFLHRAGKLPCCTYNTESGGRLD